MSENHDAIVADNPPEGGCPVRAAHPTQGGGNRQWWPDRLNLKILAKNPAVANRWASSSATPGRSAPSTSRGQAGHRAGATTSQDWWLLDFGHYGPFIIRWPGIAPTTYRISDGRGGGGAGSSGSPR
jgi:catalase-peroxidase